MQLTPSLSKLLQDFFQDWLIEQSNVSRHTILSYRDGWRQFLRFVARQHHRRVTELELTHLSAQQVVAFLHHLEQERKVKIVTRNCRLAAIRSFFHYVADREPAVAEQCAAVLRLPCKRGPRPTLPYLEVEEVAAILAQPDHKTLKGQRDHALLVFLYNTGARIQEALDVTPACLSLQPPAFVRLFGKGRKERICPLWSETAKLLKGVLHRVSPQPNGPVFTNRYGGPLTASGVRYLLRGYLKTAIRQAPSLATKPISPHSFRHATAVHLLASGVDITVVRSWLGHAQLETTNLYAQVNLESKRKALEHFKVDSIPCKPPRWKRDPGLLAWLESF